MKRLMALALLAFAVGCASQPQIEPLEALVFPPPPAEPRFVFERIVLGSADVEEVDKKTRWRQLLTGEVERGKGFGKPFDIAACQGQIFVSDTVRRSVMILDVPQRNFLEFGTEEPGELRKPLGLAVDADCNVYVADATTRRIMIFDQRGQFLKAVGGAELFDRLSHVAVDDDGTRIFAVDTGGVESQNHHIRVLDVATGNHLYDISTRGSGPGQLNLPRDIDMGADGNLYVVDGGNFRVQVFTQDGKFVRSFGALGRRYGQFARPKGIALDPQGNVYVSDGAFGNFQIFDPEGQLLLFIGSRSEKFERATYMLPAGIDVDEDGRVYMVDQYFRKFDIYRPVALNEQEGFIGAWNLN